MGLNPLEKQQIRKAIERAIEEYNKCRSSEVTAKLISLNKKFLK